MAFNNAGLQATTEAADEPAEPSRDLTPRALAHWACDRAHALADNFIGDQLNLASVEPRQRLAVDARVLQLVEGPVARAPEDHLAERFVAAPRRDGVLAEGLDVPEPSLER